MSLVGQTVLAVDGTATCACKAFRDSPDLQTVRVPELYAISRPATALTGDFYLRHEDSSSAVFALGDVTGHGLEAAVYMLMIQEEIERLLPEHAALSSLVAELHGTLLRELPSRRFASLVLARLDRSGALELVNAGHCQPLLRRAGGEVEVLPSSGPIVGALPGVRWQTLRTTLSPGDTLLLYSDGVIETTAPPREGHGEDGEELGIERLREVFLEHGGLPPHELAARIQALLDGFRGGAPLQDDTTLLIARA